MPDMETKKPAIAPQPQQATAKKSEPVKPKVRAIDDEMLGTGDDSDQSDIERISNSIRVIEHGFGWVSQKAELGLDELKAEILKEDKPDWITKVGGGLLEIALSAGAAGGAEFIAGKLVEESFDALKEFVKASFEEGITKGLEAGHKLLGSEKSDAAEAFIASQKGAVQALYKANQTKFIHSGSHKIKTVKQATDLETAFSDENSAAAGEKHRDAARHGWLCFLAQSKFGSLPNPKGGPATTNILTEGEREENNRQWLVGEAPLMPEAAPSTVGAITGRAPGVLSVVARLPKISNGALKSTPVVDASFLNGVNQTMREAYQHKVLATLPIPRHIDARVEGGMPSFSLNLDERGNSSHLSPMQAQWLHAYAKIHDPAIGEKSEFEQQQLGIKLLLQALVTSEIRKAVL